MSQPPKRPGPTLPKPPTNHSPTSTLADTALLTGTHTITVASNAIIHPRAKLLSTHGIVNIGEGCIICERSSVGLTSAERMMGGENDVQEGVVLGRGVVVEQGAVVEAGSVGEGCVVEVGARVGRGCVLGKHCKIGPLCVVPANEVLPDYTMVYGNGERRMDRSAVEDLKMRMNEKHVEVLKKLIPSNLAKFQ